MASNSHTLTREGWGTTWEMSNSLRVTDHKLLRLRRHFFPLSLFFWSLVIHDIGELTDRRGRQLCKCFLLKNASKTFFWALRHLSETKKSPGKISPHSRSIAVVTTADQLASSGKDYGSTHFLRMSRRADGLHIKGLHPRQWPFLKAEQVGERRHPLRKGKGLKWHDVPKASVTEERLDRRLGVKYHHLDFVCMDSWHFRWMNTAQGLDTHQKAWLRRINKSHHGDIKGALCSFGEEFFIRRERSSLTELWQKKN